MLPIFLFMVLLPPSLFLKYYYSGTDTTDLAVMSSVALYATVVISTIYVYRLLERPPDDTLLDLNIVPARPIAEAPICALYRTSLMRTSSPAKPFILATIPSCPNPAIHPKFEWAPVSSPVSPFLQPVCKVTAGPPALPASRSALYRIKPSSSAIVSLGFAVFLLILGLYLVGPEAVLWLEEIDKEHLAKLALAKDLAIVKPALQDVAISELNAPASDASTLHIPTKEAPVKPRTQPSPSKPVKCRHAGGKRVAHVRPRASTTSSSPSPGKKKPRT